MNQASIITQNAARSVLMKTPSWLFLLILTVFLTGGSAVSGYAQEAGEKPVVSSISEFSIKIYRKLAAGAYNNLIISPLSVHLILSALSSAADSETKSEMHRVLGLATSGIDPNQLDESYAQLIGQLQNIPVSNGKPAYALSVANAAWLKQGYQVKPDFRASLQQNYRAQIEDVDYSNKAQAAKHINTWVSEKTNGKIKDLIDKEAIDSLVRLILTNAVYFKSRWEHQFIEDATSTESFRISATESVQVPLMNDLQSIPYYEDDKVQLIALPYVGHCLYLIVALPREKDGLTALEEELSHAGLNLWFSQMKAARVNYYLPRFSFSRELELSETLKALGLNRALDPENAWFPGINEQEKLAISKILHQGFISVDEQGTEAAAATAVMLAGSAYVPEPPKVFRADHPFMFFILHRETNAVIFLGRITRPS